MENESQTSASEPSIAELSPQPTESQLAIPNQSEPTVIDPSLIEQPQMPPLAPEPVFAPSTSEPSHESIAPSPKSFLAKALESIQFRKKAKLEKIMKLAIEKKSITNDQVQKLIRVSDATATRYLSELVRQNRLKRVGAPQNPTYRPLGGSNGGD